MSTRPDPRWTRIYDRLEVCCLATEVAMAQAAADEAEAVLDRAVRDRGRARVVLATGTSQLAFLRELRARELDWSRVELFHMDEYVGIRPDHPASFRHFLHRHIVDVVTPSAFHGIAGDAADTDSECTRYAALLARAPIDLVCMGIGENGHLAFNDPPLADFEDSRPVRVVELDRVSRQQQVNEGHFSALEEVPTHAITMTIPALLDCGRAVVVVPESRKAPAVACALEGPVSPRCPASILRTVDHATLYLEPGSASHLGAEPQVSAEGP